ncbi:hypothetical protein K1719_014419 [Acacia pycnantha]|nr:hypothetical protein K1719_014419 [Acacia pycnantha]
MGWIRLPKLPAQYYHKSVIRSIGSVFGEVIRVDYNTDSGDRGKFARIAVCIDLTKPLISKILVDGELILVEYEGLPTICFSCGKYGHLQEACPAKLASSSGEVPLASETNIPKPDLQARESSLFGSWMQVQRRRRLPARGDKANEAKGIPKAVSASRYEILSEYQEDEMPREQVLAEEGHSTKVDNRKKNDSESKASKNKAPTSLDPSKHSAFHVLDPRTPRRPTEPHASLPGPNGAASLHGNDPFSTSRGLKLSSGVTIHKLGSKPNPDKLGPSTSILKQITNDLQDVNDSIEEASQPEGVDLNPNLPL